MTKNLLLGCGIIFGIFVLIFIGALVYFGSQPESGVKLANEMDPYALEYIETHGLLDPSEKLIAYYDVTLSMDSTEAALLTDERVLYHKDGQTNSLTLRSVEEINHRKETLIGDVIEVHGSEGSMKIEIAPLNQGETFLTALRRAWESTQSSQDASAEAPAEPVADSR
jgi:hypothetical protein